MNEHNQSIFPNYYQGNFFNFHKRVGETPNLGIGISALVMASASALKYKHCLLHSCKCLVLTPCPN